MGIINYLYIHFLTSLFTKYIHSSHCEMNSFFIKNIIKLNVIFSQTGESPNYSSGFWIKSKIFREIFSITLFLKCFKTIYRYFIDYIWPFSQKPVFNFKSLILKKSLTCKFYSIIIFHVHFLWVGLKFW